MISLKNTNDEIGDSFFSATLSSMTRPLPKSLLIGHQPEYVLM